ncbi:D-Ribose-5-Phosphate Isomerase [Vairimorpha necatrix]|uniref:Ribose-5-phosphate isomerase n=1 Tax=Vairimorpha necatrix TaxID=6039 RepID=A0AAX4JFF2_9MICR
MLKTTIETICKSKSIVGIGTGRTVESILPYLNPNLQYVSSSHQTTRSLLNYSIHCYPLESIDHLDLYIDGCDYFDKKGNMIKGKGGSLTTEKLMCTMADEVLIIVQNYKYRECFEDCYVPIEILPGSVKYIEKILKKKNVKYELRRGENKFGPVITDLGNFIVDVVFDEKFLNECREICGVVEHGYFAVDDYNIKVKTFEE